MHSESTTVAEVDPSLFQILFNEEFESPFVIVHSVSFVEADSHSVGVLLLRVEKDESDVQGSGFHVSLEWVTIREAAKEGESATDFGSTYVKGML